MFTTSLEDVAAFEKRAEQAFTGEKTIEDEDELLYGDADAKEVRRYKKGVLCSAVTFF